MWTTDLNINCKSKKLLEDNIAENLYDLGYSNFFSEIVSKVQSMKEIISKLDIIKIKKFCSVKENVKRIRQ